MDAPGWLYELMDLLGLDILEQANWIRAWDRSRDWRVPERRELDRLRRFQEMGLVGQREVLQAKAQCMGVGFVDLDRVYVEPSAFRDVSRNLVTQTGALPVKRDGSTLWLAMSRDDLEVLNAYKLATGCRVVPVLAESVAIEAAVRKYFPEGG